MPYVFKMSIAACEKIFTMLIFDVSLKKYDCNIYMTEKIWRCSIFEVDHAISFKNMITRQDVVFNLIGSGNDIL